MKNNLKNILLLAGFMLSTYAISPFTYAIDLSGTIYYQGLSSETDANGNFYIFGVHGVTDANGSFILDRTLANIAANEPATYGSGTLVLKTITSSPSKKIDLTGFIKYNGVTIPVDREGNMVLVSGGKTYYGKIDAQGNYMFGNGTNGNIFDAVNTPGVTSLYLDSTKKTYDVNQVDPVSLSALHLTGSSSPSVFYGYNGQAYTRNMPTGNSFLGSNGVIYTADQIKALYKNFKSYGDEVLFLAQNGLNYPDLYKMRYLVDPVNASTLAIYTDPKEYDAYAIWLKAGGHLAFDQWRATKSSAYLASLQAGPVSNMGWLGGPECGIPVNKNPNSKTSNITAVPVSTCNGVISYSSSTASGNQTTSNSSVNLAPISITTQNPSRLTTTNTGSVNPYAPTLSWDIQKIINKWIKDSVIPKSKTLTTEKYLTLLNELVKRLSQIKAETPASNKKLINTINYLSYELQKLIDGTNNDTTSFLNSLFR